MHERKVWKLQVQRRKRSKNVRCDKNRVYIHFGDDTFRPETIEKIVYRKDKPSGLWASPLDSNWRWDHWCKSSGCRSEEELAPRFMFKLSGKARVLHVHTLKDLEPYINDHNHYLGFDDRLDFRTLYKKYDAMEVHMSSNWCELHDYFLLYTWDVDSLVVWNPDVARVIKDKGSEA